MIIQEIKATKKLMEIAKARDAQIKWYNDLLRVAKVVKVERCEDVLPPGDVDIIKNYIRPELKQCYKNATRLSEIEGYGYCEGKVSLADIGLSIDHAFNSFIDENGEKHYIDITFQYALDMSVTDREYVVFGEYDWRTICQIAHKTGSYGDYYRYMWMQSKKKPTGEREKPAGEGSVKSNGIANHGCKITKKKR